MFHTRQVCYDFRTGRTSSLCIGIIKKSFSSHPEEAILVLTLASLAYIHALEMEVKTFVYYW